MGLSIGGEIEAARAPMHGCHACSWKTAAGGHPIAVRRSITASAERPTLSPISPRASGTTTWSAKTANSCSHVAHGRSGHRLCAVSANRARRNPLGGGGRWHAQGRCPGDRLQLDLQEPGVRSQYRRDPAGGPPQWLLARERLGQALRHKPERFDRTWESKSRYSMDWFYPVLAGV